MKHIWERGTTVSTPDSPPEGYSYCETCGVEETDDNRAEDCPACPDCGGAGEVTHEYGFSADLEPRQETRDCETCGGGGVVAEGGR